MNWKSCTAVAAFSDYEIEESLKLGWGGKERAREEQSLSFNLRQFSGFKAHVSIKQSLLFCSLIC